MVEFKFLKLSFFHSLIRAVIFCSLALINSISIRESVFWKIKSAAPLLFYFTFDAWGRIFIFSTLFVSLLKEKDREWKKRAATLFQGRPFRRNYILQHCVFLPTSREREKKVIRGHLSLSSLLPGATLKRREKKKCNCSERRLFIKKQLAINFSPRRAAHQKEKRESPPRCRQRIINEREREKSSSSLLLLYNNPTAAAAASSLLRSLRTTKSRKY